MAQSFIFQLEEEEEDIFFDSRDEIPSASGSCLGSPGRSSSAEDQIGNWAFGYPAAEAWIKDPGSIRERRVKFMRLMGLDLTSSTSWEPVVSPDGKLTMEREIQLDIARIMSDSGAVIGSSCSENSCSVPSWSSGDTNENGKFDENFMCSIRYLDDGTVFVVDGLGRDGVLQSLRKVGSNRTLSLDEIKKGFGLSSLILQLMRRVDFGSRNSDQLARRTRVGLWRRMGIAACLVNRQEESNSCFSDSGKSGNWSRRIKVRPYRKQSKEFSAVYKGQDFKAHDGEILAMKFSPDGQYLATGGEDGVVRIWRVMECERKGDTGIPKDDSSCIFFTVNHNSELIPENPDKKNVKSTSLRMTRDSACVVIPPEIFRLSEVPVHEFCGHNGEVLDLSWSKNKCLLSSSTDYTVRLWQIESDRCLKVFPHNNYVTCLQFNPVDENYFMSGSIDGKVRIWKISSCHVVDWVDIREIVTAVSYHPGGQGAVVGTMTGNCYFYEALDNILQLSAKVSLQSKKKYRLRRITGFQFCPTDTQKLMVTSADSQIRILDGVDVVSKYKGQQNSGSQISASFTADGRHIISVSEDSNVYVWNHISHGMPKSNHVKSTWSCERIFSSNASVAIPWHGLQFKNRVSGTFPVLHSQEVFIAVSDYVSNTHVEDAIGSDTLYLSPFQSFTLNHEFFSEFLPKGSATWPEEKLPSNSAASALFKSHYKFLRDSCQNTSHAWGQVIVIGGWDGWIRSYQNFGLPLHR